MSLIVQKFGGSSVGDAERLRHVADLIAEAYRAGDDVITVLSAQGDTTDELLERAAEVNPHPSRRELDMLLTTGEQASVALCAMALERLGLPCVSLTGWQAGVRTDGRHGDAKIQEVDTRRIAAELARRRIVLVTGFQGVDDNEDLTTLGRGGSDTSAVALAAAFHAERCRICTDVDGVYTADPRVVPTARKLPAISYDEMLELAAQGAAVLHDRSVELAKSSGVVLEVCSSLEAKPGTEVRTGAETPPIAGIAGDGKIVRFRLSGVSARPGVLFRVLETLERGGLRAQLPYQREDEIVFTLPGEQAGEAELLLAAKREALDFRHLETDRTVCKVSAVGRVGECCASAQIREALREAGIHVFQTEYSENRISLLLARPDMEAAMRSIHARLFEKKDA